MDFPCADLDFIPNAIASQLRGITVKREANENKNVKRLNTGL